MWFVGLIVSQFTTLVQIKDSSIDDGESRLSVMWVGLVNSLIWFTVRRLVQFTGFHDSESKGRLGSILIILCWQCIPIDYTTHTDIHLL